MRNRNRLLMIAVSAGSVALLSNHAQAQFRAGSDGHAFDANNRVGSGGVNDAGRGSQGGVSGNDIVTGNVTGGRQFRGGVDYTDPWAFRGNLAGRGLDSFIRDSSGVPSAYAPAFSSDQPRAFYGDSRGVVAPVGSAKIGFTGAYVGTSLQSSNPYSSSLVQAQTDTLQDNRIGSTQVVGYDQALSATGSVLALPGSLDSSAPNMQSVLLATPLTGVMQYNGLNSTDNFILERYLATRRPGEVLPQDISNSTIQQMQQDLRVQAVSEAGQPLNPAITDTTQNGSGTTAPKNGNTAQPGANGPIQSAPLNGSQPISSDPIDSAINPQQPLGAQGTTPESFRRSLLVPPARQSAQYAELRKRLDQYNRDHGITDEEANRQFRLEQHALTQANPAAGQKNTPGGATRPANPSQAAENPVAPEKENGPPVKINSLATGVKAKGLHDLLASGEDLMREDKFASAILKFNDAEKVAPNNPLTALGRAHAELGAAYYGKAEADLRRVVAVDPALLMGQFDLSAVMNAQRLAYVQKDLKDLAAKDARSERPWFLLAYIAYNTGDGAAAAQYLDEAQKRTMANDKVIQMMKSHWALSTTKPAQDLNK